MRLRRIGLVAAAIIIIVTLILIVMLGSITQSAFSTHAEPSAMEAAMARRMRALAVPSDLQNATNPVPPTPEVLAEARAHFADHCAGCHGNDGKGTDLGRRMYPKTPDMTLPPTQTLSDGALFSIIENGIRLTGMPGFGSGTAESAYGSWTLVHFIRHLPEVTPQELAEMQRLNPKTPEEWRRMSMPVGDSSQPTPAASHDTAPHHH